MKMRSLIFYMTGMILLLAACGPESPSEAEIRAKIIGTYCADDYQLVITETTYSNAKTTPGVLSKTPLRESCRGTYSLVFEKDSWIIRFDKDESPRGIQNCKVEYPLWTKNEGYLFGEEKAVMKELFDGKEVSKDACEEF